MTKLSHLDDTGSVRMVDVGKKSVTLRKAVAGGSIKMSNLAIAAISEARVKKGSVLETARIAGIMAAKRTAELIPLCHSLPLDSIAIDMTVLPDRIETTATAITHGKTGVEMEAMVAASTALLTIYDMAKGVDREMVIDGVRLLEKSGGKSGDWARNEERKPNT
ncbi:MAG: cyclic pyranopterin monophosphate synthase MoaC [Pontixanthobacter sp.]